MNELRALLERHGQEQLLRFWDELDAGERARLAADVGEIDLDLMDELVASLLDRAESIDPRTVEPPDVVRPGPEDVGTGRAALAAGEVAVVIVAGGQGTRLGFDGPKGTLPDRPGLRPVASFRSTPRRSLPSAAATGRPSRSTS